MSLMRHAAGEEFRKRDSFFMHKKEFLLLTEKRKLTEYKSYGKISRRCAAECQPMELLSNRIRPHGQAVKTSPFHGGNTSSNLVGVIMAT